MARIGFRRWRRTGLDLTDRQEQVLRLIERGLTNGQIATELGITLDGVKFHVSEILAKLDVGSREEAVQVWRTSARGSAFTFPFALRVLGLAGAAMVGAAVVILIVSVVRRGEETQPAAPATVAPGATPSEVAIATQSPNSNCPPPRTPTPTPPPGSTEVPVPPEDGPGAVRFFDRWYWPVTDSASLPLPATLVGPQFAEVCFVRPRMVPTPSGGDQPRDGDSSIESHEVGSPIFEVVGYEPTFRLAVEITGVWFLFEAREPGNGQTAADILDLDGKVERIEILGPLVADLRAVIDDPPTIDSLISGLLASPLAPMVGRGPGEEPVWIRFVFLDGTATTRPLVLSDPPRLDGFILVSDEFVGPIVAALEGAQ